MAAIQQCMFAAGVVRDDTLAPQQFFPSTSPLEVAQGDSLKVRLKIYKADGTAQDITGTTSRAALKPRAPAQAAVALTVNGTIVDAPTGVVDFVFTAAQLAGLALGNYLWDVILIDDQNPANKTRVVLLSNFVVVDGVAS